MTDPTTTPSPDETRPEVYVCGQWETNCNNRVWPPMHSKACADRSAALPAAPEREGEGRACECGHSKCPGESLCCCLGDEGALHPEEHRPVGPEGCPSCGAPDRFTVRLARKDTSMTPDDVKARAVEVLVRAAHRHACKRVRQNGGEEGIEWVRWKRLPEFAQEPYRAEARDLVKALRAAGFLADPDMLGRTKAEAWDEGWAAGCNDQQYGNEDAEPWTPNPYRADRIDPDGSKG